MDFRLIASGGTRASFAKTSSPPEHSGADDPASALSVRATFRFWSDIWSRRPWGASRAEISIERGVPAQLLTVAGQCGIAQRKFRPSSMEADGVGSRIGAAFAGALFQRHGRCSEEREAGWSGRNPPAPRLNARQRSALASQNNKSKAAKPGLLRKQPVQEIAGAGLRPNEYGAAMRRRFHKVWSDVAPSLELSKKALSIRRRAWHGIPLNKY